MIRDFKAMRIFISYRGLDFDLASRVRLHLEQEGFEVQMYDPGELWDEPVEEMVSGIERSNFLIWLRNARSATDWIKPELRWANACKVPVVVLDDESELEHKIEKAKSCRSNPKKWENCSERYEALEKAFTTVDENDRAQSSEFSSANWDARLEADENTSETALFLVKIVIASVVTLFALIGAVIGLYYQPIVSFCLFSLAFMSSYVLLTVLGIKPLNCFLGLRRRSTRTCRKARRTS